jgi:enterochelin esterase family protein
MIVVMPHGHTRRGAAAAGASPIARTATQEFVDDFVKDVRPHVEKNYRVMTGRSNTAIAGLSMGGGQTLQAAIRDLDDYGYIGVYSSGLLGAFPGVGGRRGAPPAAPAAPAPQQQSAAEWEKEHQAVLDNAGLKKGLKLLWFATGKDDFLVQTTVATVELFKKHGFTPVYMESAGGHTWINWRNYLNEFAPQLFQ